MESNQDQESLKLHVSWAPGLMFVRLIFGCTMVFSGLAQAFRPFIPLWLIALQFLIGALYIYQFLFLSKNGYLRVDFEKIRITRGDFVKFEVILFQNIKRIRQEGDKFVLALSNGKERSLSEKSILKREREEFVQTMKALQKEINPEK
jgi:hypothetical protein